MSKTGRLSEPMEWVLDICTERGGAVLRRDLLLPGSPNVEHASLGRTLRRMRKRGLVRLLMESREPGAPPRRKNYVWQVVLTDAGRAAARLKTKEGQDRPAVRSRPEYRFSGCPDCRRRTIDSLSRLNYRRAPGAPM